MPMRVDAAPLRKVGIIMVLLFTPVLLLSGPTGCGYTLVGHEVAATTSRITLAVAPFANQSREPDLETRMTAALRWAMLQNRVFNLTSASRAHRLLYGTVRRFRVIPVSFDTNDNVLQYRLEADVGIRLVETSSKTPTVERELSAWAEYLVSNTGVVRENVVAREAAFARLAEQFAGKCTALLTVMLL